MQLSTKIRVMRVLFFIVVGVIFIGCATVSYVKPIKPSKTPSPDQAYLYGRFKFTKKYSSLRLAIGLTNLSSKEELNIRFSEGSGIAVIGVSPGKYQVTHKIVAVLGASEKQESSNTPFLSPVLSEPFNVKPGNAYYIGDYFGWTKFGKLGIFRTTFKGDIERSENNFEQTTREFKSEYPNFSKMASVSP